jgi:5'-methylthioadenosine phosphorylase
VGEEPVTVDMVVRTLSRNIKLAQDTIRKMVTLIEENTPCDCQNALNNALITDKDHIDPEKRKQLGILIDKYLD